MSGRNQIKRGPKRKVEDYQQALAIIDESWICHLGIDAGGYPLVLPTAHWRQGEYLYLHGHARNGLLTKALEQPLCVCFTLLDGLVLAKSGFNHSMNYRSLVVFGQPERVEGEHKRESLDYFVDRIVPGRAAVVRPLTDIELQATLVIRLRLDEWSCKIRQGGPNDDAADGDWPVWSGVLPLRLQAGEWQVAQADGPVPESATPALHGLPAN
ncbi:pyridoxamine 5'-phosphate oxidase family protein [Balneatrix alpica]|uniref:Pyridoxamine 5'-phosphate oxidase family protein n=1 Tax=Balneatrix alpica TaxID=75684 RepID=A0ABV5ZGR7_9GAMM|nr:pyridoxamine 5'-phosphate oxidase family protein [Balneatrix alpica]